MVSGIQIIGVLFALGQCYFTFLHYKREEFTVREMAAWLFVWAGFGVVTVFPETFKVLAGNFGTLRPLDLFTIIGFIVVLSISFYTYVNLDRVRRTLEKSIRDMALKDEDIK